MIFDRTGRGIFLLPAHEPFGEKGIGKEIGSITKRYSQEEIHVADLTSTPVPEERKEKNIQVPFSKEQEKNLKLHKLVIAAEAAVIVILIALRWAVGGWWIDWNTTWGSSTEKNPEESEPASETVYMEIDPSELEPNAVLGVPTVDTSLGWSVLNIQEGYDVHLCSILNADAKGSLPIWFSSESTNTVWVKLRILDEDGNVLGETGLLKPGEYVERLQLSKGTTSCAVTVQVMGYAPGTHYSAGSVGLANTLVVENE